MPTSGEMELSLRFSKMNFLLILASFFIFPLHHPMRSLSSKVQVTPGGRGNMNPLLNKGCWTDLRLTEIALIC